MKVKELIRQLKQEDKNAEVGYAHMDNSEDECAGSVCSVREACDKLKEEGIGVILRG